MASMYQAEPQELIKRAAEELKKNNFVKPPEWAGIVKTGHFRQRPPVHDDWWYMRAASVLRTVYRLGPIGTNKLRAKYGGKKNMGMAPERAAKGSGSVIRRVLQQLEKAEYIKTTNIKGHKGRIITPKGQSFLDKIAAQMILEQRKAQPKTAPAERKEKAEPKAPKQKEHKPVEAAAPAEQ